MSEWVFVFACGPRCHLFHAMAYDNPQLIVYDPHKYIKIAPKCTSIEYTYVFLDSFWANHKLLTFVADSIASLCDFRNEFGSMRMVQSRNRSTLPFFIHSRNSRLSKRKHTTEPSW